MEKKKQQSNFIIPLVVYPFDVMVSIDQTDEELIKECSKYSLTKKDLKKAGALALVNEEGRCVIFKRNQMLIRIRKFEPTPRWYGTLQHEIFHCVEFLMYKLRVNLTPHSDEPYAYLIGYLTEEIYKLL